jgi:hypothetical protein
LVVRGAGFGGHMKLVNGNQSTSSRKEMTTMMMLLRSMVRAIYNPARDRIRSHPMDGNGRRA